MAINLRDYSKTAAQKGWGAGWPSCGGAKAAGTAVVTADRSGVRLSVHKRIARLVDLLLDATEARGYLLKNGQCGGYNCRAISGTNSPSNHSWGLAVDLNWQTNPYKAPLTTDMPSWMPKLWNRYGFAWGGDYTGARDAMHYEFMGTPADADAMTALALAELTNTPSTASTDWLDMASLDDVRRAVWDAPIDDPIGKKPMPAYAQLEWACAHAAYARGSSEQALQKVAAIEQVVSRLTAGPAGVAVAGGGLSDSDVQRIAQAVVALIGKKASA